MKAISFVLASSAFFALPASAAVYACQGTSFCECQTTDGCSGIDQYLSDEPTEICRPVTRTFEAKVQRRKIVVNGDNLKLTFTEARPYFNDFDRYQAGAREDRGLVNLSFDNESDRTDFRMRQMADRSVNEHVWVLSGSCERIE